MTQNKGVFWLASYPKSGNTWMRSFIQGMHSLKGISEKKELLAGSGEEITLNEKGLIDINKMRTGFIASSRIMVQQILGFELSDFSNDEVDFFRKDVYDWHARNVNVLQYHKVHDAYVYLPEGTPMFSQDSCIGVLYIVRNPFDIAISYANHSSLSLDDSIKCINSTQYALADPRYTINSQLRQKMYNWSQHVLSWLNAKHMNVKCVRYEDMKQRPLETFSEVAKFLQISDNIDEVKTVLEEIRIEKLQKQEKEKGFKEKTAVSETFFRKGIVGDWEETLTQKQIQQITQCHGEVMQQLGYLDEAYQPSADIRLRKQ